jgi:hypothetical protein
MLPGALVKQLREKQSLSVNSWQRFWWPNVDTPENAASAAKNGGVAFGFIALGHAIEWIRLAVHYRQALLRETQFFRDHPPPPQHHGLHTIIPLLQRPVLLRAPAHVLLLVTLLIAALLAWRTYKRPSLLLCTIALVWVLFVFVGLPALAWVQFDFFPVWTDVLGVGIYCAQILGIVAGLGGVRGALAARRFQHLSSEGAV